MSQKLNYTLTVADKVMDMSKKQKNSVVPGLKKNEIISRILAESGFIFTIDIADNSSIKPAEMPLQKAETNLNFLYKCARKWNCLFWHDGDKCYFVDAEKAHAYGNIARLKGNIEDLKTEYELNFRTALKENNIANISWTIGKDQGGAPGKPGVKGANEEGEVKEIDDFEIVVEDVKYRLKDDIIKEIKKDPSLNAKYFSATLMTEVSRSNDRLREYFVASTKGSATNKDLTQKPTHRWGAAKIDVDLNKGDPFLRPPRTVFLQCGSSSKDSYLPAFLFRDNPDRQEYNINKVKIALANGMITTKIQATMGKQKK